MKIRPILLAIALAGCAVESTPPALNEIEQHFNDCNPITCGGGGTGGGTGGDEGTCETINCAGDAVCQVLCGNLGASCVRWSNGTSSGGFCLDW